MEDPPATDRCEMAPPYGVAIAGRPVLRSEEMGDPLGRFSSLQVADRPYNLWLSDEVLDVVLQRWNRSPFDGREPPATVASDVAWACLRCRLAFQEIAPAAAELGDPAVIVAMGVTANLQRTVAVLGELILDGGQPAGHGPPLRLSRFLCGLAEYPEHCPYFPSAPQPLIHAGRLRSNRRDIRYLVNALWCAADSINRSCEEALGILGDKIRRQGCFGPGDLRHLHAHSVPGSFR